jgi:hypothetical protein
MTCIVGIVDGGVVLMGSDSAATDDSGSIEIQKASKTFTLQVPLVGPTKRSMPMLVGFAGSFRIAQILQWSFKVPKWDPTHPLMEYLVSRFVPALHAAVLTALGEPKAPEGTEAHALRDSSFLIGFQGRLFTLESNGQIMEALHGYSSVGSGALVALGAMWSATKAAQAAEPWTVLEVGLGAAEYFISTVRRPFYIEYVMS